MSARAPRKILFVCTGNICRSPLAVGVLSKIVEQEHLAAKAESAGLMRVLPGAGPVEEAKAVAKRHGIDIDGHRVRTLDRAMLHGADLVLTMTRQQRDHLREAFRRYQRRIHMLSEIAVGEEKDIRDPYGGGAAEYEECFREIASYLNIMAAGGKLGAPPRGQAPTP
jgi:protein-tyrosine-phosphatase